MRTKPDQVTLTFGVSTWTQGASAAEAEALNLASRDRLIDTLKRSGADDAKIDAAHPQVTPLTRQDYAGKTYLTGFEAVTRVVVRVTAVGRADALIASGLANGATSLEAVVYGLTNPETASQKAVQAAMENAQERASAILGAQDQPLGDLVSIEILQEESHTPETKTSPGALLFRAKVKATYKF